MSKSTVNDNNNGNKEEQPQEVVVVEEEEWTHLDGSNVFGGLLDDTTTTHPLSSVSFGEVVLKYKSLQERHMTPLDMTYTYRYPNEKKTSADDDDDEFYDGTGHLVWMASLSFGYLLANDDLDLVGRYFGNKQEAEPSSSSKRRICELGCGTGVAGIATLLFSSPSSNTVVVFTDNDQEALELAKANCELNGIETHRYSQELLSWGEEASSSSSSVPARSFDTVLATDVLYDIPMIPLLMQTAAALLLPSGGHVILSHVPRFCLPKTQEEEQQESSSRRQQSQSPPPPSQAYQKLEDHIVAQAKWAGLSLIETIRPHQVLEPSATLATTTTTTTTRNEASSLHPSRYSLSLPQLEEMRSAVVFIFENDTSRA
jgi:2-polyprenyl-3-methyl-5-hydroxy-6-metoxy-1,4-benzoquinol methylase